MSERTVTVAEAAQALGISEKAVRRRIERNVLPSVMGPDKRRRVPVSALGGDDDTAAHVSPRPAGVPASSTGNADLLDRLERLAREAGAVRLIEEVAGRDREALLEARARIRELEQQLAARPRRWWQR